MKAEGFTEKDIKEARHKEVFNPCTRVKLAVASKKIPLGNILDETYKFQKDSIFYDVAARPTNHFKAFYYKLAQFFESEKLKKFNCFPLRTFIPAYITLDSKIVNSHIIKSKKPMNDKTETWKKVISVDLKKRPFKDQGVKKSLRFEGTIETDGIGMFQPKLQRRKDDCTKYIETLTQAELANSSKNCVLIDPGRRDLLYCMKETKFCEKLTKPTVIKNSEALLSKEQSSTVDVDKFLRYINARASMDKVLSQYYGTETQKSEEIHSPDSCFDFHVNEKGNLYFGGLYVTRIQDFPQQHNMVSLEKLTNSQCEQAGLRQRASELLEKLQILPFRKLKFLIKLYYNQIDEKLVRNLQEKFGSDAILVFGNWSAANTKYHEPTRNKSLIRMLKKNGFTVHLADKFKTSSKCP
ncbi:hypothetical protein EDC94DRAFT_643148 [Helicostylum pulchrum]|nr:hypothetical protein EDC94DRAFT_643148 [Helicostylum pulchrum]